MSAHGNEAAEANRFPVLDNEDWKVIESSPEFTRLVAERRRVVLPSLVVFVLWFGAFTVLAAWDHHWMASEIFSGFSVAYAAALSLIVMTWVLTAIYIRASNRRIDPLADDVRRLVEAREHDASGPSRGRSVPPTEQVAR